jgi:hypothetical protein
LPNPVLTANGRRFATGSAIFRGSPLGDPANCCTFGHIRHNWQGSANRMKTLTAKDTKHGFGTHGRPIIVGTAAEVRTADRIDRVGEEIKAQDV